MPLVSRTTTYTANTVISPTVHNTEHDDFVSGINGIDTRVTAIESGNLTITGNKTFSGTSTLSGAVNISGVLTASHATGVTTNTITERTAGSGVTADGVLLKDSMAVVSGTPTTGGQIGYASNTLAWHDGTSANNVPKTITTAKAWVTFNGSGTAAITADYGVASLTDNGTGDYTITYDASITNPCVIGTASSPTAGNAGASGNLCIITNGTASCRINTSQLGGTLANMYDPTIVCLAVFGE